MYRCGALVKKTAVQYAPISPSKTILKKLAKAGGAVGSSYIISATAKREAQKVTLTKWYASRLGTMLSAGKQGAGAPTPGGLMRSIAFSSDNTHAEIYVPANSEAGKYAYRIHEEKGITWFKRGPGTQAKGGKADAKFIERAIEDDKGQLITIIQDEMDKALNKMRNGEGVGR